VALFKPRQLTGGTDEVQVAKNFPEKTGTIEKQVYTR
jgi:hypothetical protein